jgi:acetylglutamate kinase
VDEAQRSPVQPPTRPIVVKIGGSTLGAGDTSLDDVAGLARDGRRPVVVHGGGALITEWLDRSGVSSEFVEGLRATSAEALDVVIAVLRGVVNARLVAELARRGARAVGVSGLDAGTLHAERYDERLGYVGRVTRVDPTYLEALLAAGTVPVIAPIALEPPAQPLNVNADSAAGEIARALHAERLIFLTDVDGVLDARGELVPVLDTERVGELREAGVLSGGMLPKVDASLRAAEGGAIASIANGRVSNTVRTIVSGSDAGTRLEG